MSGGVIKAVFVGDDTDVGEVAKEHQVAKLELVFRSRGAEARPQRARAGALKADSRCLECAPDET